MSGIFGRPMRPVIFWGMWLLLGPSTILIAASLAQMLREPFTPKALIPIVALGAQVCLFVGALVRVTRHYAVSRKDGHDDERRDVE